MHKHASLKVWSESDGHDSHSTENVRWLSITFIPHMRILVKWRKKTTILHVFTLRLYAGQACMECYDGCMWLFLFARGAHSPCTRRRLRQWSVFKQKFSIWWLVRTCFLTEWGPDRLKVLISRTSIMTSVSSFGKRMLGNDVKPVTPQYWNRKNLVATVGPNFSFTQLFSNRLYLSL